MEHGSGKAHLQKAIRGQQVAEVGTRWLWEKEEETPKVREQSEGGAGWTEKGDIRIRERAPRSE